MIDAGDSEVILSGIGRGIAKRLEDPAQQKNYRKSKTDMKPIEV